MSYKIVTDTAANLPAAYLREHGVIALPFSFFVNGEERTCTGPDEFDGKAFYDLLREGTDVKTALINQQRYNDCFIPLLEAGEDILFIGMSSGISGSMHVGKLAAQELEERYPERKIVIIDTFAASLGEAVSVRVAIRLREEGKSLGELASILLQLRSHVCQYFTVDDLMFLRRGGRISNFSAVLGTVLGIKPLLRGNDAGQIVLYEKVRGRKKALRALAEELEKRYMHDAPELFISIAHGDCPEEAEYLAGLIRKNHPDQSIWTECYEPVTGSHVGPGTVALFFLGDER